jgi:Glycosyl transferase family 2
MSEPRARVLREGAFFEHERFGPESVNRGAVLWECEWDGGVFESGVMLGGIFRAGEFRDGVVWATYWKGGVWKGGLWHHGFGPDGSYRPRGAFPGREPRSAEARENPVDEGAIPRATVFAASVFGDVPRLWLACLRQSLPSDEVRFEVFDDSAEGTLDEKLLPDVTLVRRSAERPDFQVAYGDALRRATTPFVAFVDTDVFWLSRDVWPRVMKKFESPRVAGVSCVSRAATESPGTFAVVMRTAVYRDVVRSVPGAFAPHVEGEAGPETPGRWRGDDTADRVARAVKEAGLEVPLLHLGDSDLFARFDAITMTRLLGGWVGQKTLLEMAVTNPYFRRGCLGALALARVHDALFAEGPRFGVPLSAARLWGRLFRHPRTFAAATRESVLIRRAAGRLRRFLSRPRGTTSNSAWIR